MYIYVKLIFGMGQLKQNRQTVLLLVSKRSADKHLFLFRSTFVFPVKQQSILWIIFSQINVKCIVPVSIFFLHTGPYNQTVDGLTSEFQGL